MRHAAPASRRWARARWRQPGCRLIACTRRGDSDSTSRRTTAWTRCPTATSRPRSRSPARLIGDVVALLTISKGLTLAYNKDLQESQEPLYDAVETARASLAVMPGLVAGLEFDVERMRAAAHDAALGATDLAEELVRGGLPFREAHEI